MPRAGLVQSTISDKYLWQDAVGRISKIEELPNAHVANIIYHMLQQVTYWGSDDGGSDEFEYNVMIKEADRRELSEAFLEGAPYPFLDSVSGLIRRAVYDSGVMRTPLTIEDPKQFVWTLRAGSTVIGLEIDPTIFGGPVWNKGLPPTSANFKYTHDAIIPWVNNFAQSIWTAWASLPEHLGALSDSDMIKFQRENVLIKVEENSMKITHVIVKLNNLELERV